MRATLLVLLAAGCDPEAAFPARLADDLCGRYAACDLGALQDAYGSLAECELILEESVSLLADSAASLQCTWSSRGVSECRRAVAATACVDFSVSQLLDACVREAWVCR